LFKIVHPNTTRSKLELIYEAAKIKK